jgi:hypothetical protein
MVEERVKKIFPRYFLPIYAFIIVISSFCYLISSSVSFCAACSAYSTNKHFPIYLFVMRFRALSFEYSSMFAPEINTVRFFPSRIQSYSHSLALFNIAFFSFRAIG